jgi:hypothetical protein
METFSVIAVSTHDRNIGLLILTTNEAQATATITMLVLPIAAL